MKTYFVGEIVRIQAGNKEEAIEEYKKTYGNQYSTVNYCYEISLSNEELERLGTIAMVRDRLADGRFSEGTVDDLFAAANEENLNG